MIAKNLLQSQHAAASNFMVYTFDAAGSMQGWIADGDGASTSANYWHSSSWSLLVFASGSYGLGYGTATHPAILCRSGSMTFYLYLPSISTANGDYAQLLMDGTVIWTTSSAQTTWLQVSVQIPAGTHTFQFYVYQSASSPDIELNVYIDTISIPIP